MNSLNLKYSLLHICYYMTYCAVFAYETVFLLDKGFGAGAIGVFSAVSGTASALLQPAAARLADQSARLTLKRLLLLITAGGLFSLLLLLLPLPLTAVGAGYVLIMMLVNLMMPLLFSISFYYTRRGQDINFGVARGLGSVAYAAGSLLLGALIPVFGLRAAPVLAALLLGAFLLLLGTFPMAPGQPAAGERGRAQAGPSFLTAFCRRYFGFLLVVLGIVLVYVCHWFLNTYLFQIVAYRGGDEQTMSAAIAVAAVTELLPMFAFSRIAKRIPVEGLLAGAAGCYLIRSLLFYLTDSLWALMGIQLLQAASFGLIIPAAVYYSDRIMAPEHKVTGQSLMTMALTAGGVIGNLLGGLLLDLFSVPVMLLAGCVFAGAGLALLLFAFGRMRRRGKVL